MNQHIIRIMISLATITALGLGGQPARAQTTTITAQWKNNSPYELIKPDKFTPYVDKDGNAVVRVIIREYFSHVTSAYHVTSTKLSPTLTNLTLGPNDYETLDSLWISGRLDSDELIGSPMQLNNALKYNELRNYVQLKRDELDLLNAALDVEKPTLAGHTPLIDPNKLFLFGDILKNARPARNAAWEGTNAIDCADVNLAQLADIKVLADRTKVNDKKVHLLDLTVDNLKTSARWTFEEDTVATGLSSPASIRMITAYAEWAVEARISPGSTDTTDDVTITSTQPVTSGAPQQPKTNSPTTGGGQAGSGSGSQTVTGFDITSANLSALSAAVPQSQPGFTYVTGVVVDQFGTPGVLGVDLTKPKDEWGAFFGKLLGSGNAASAWMLAPSYRLGKFASVIIGPAFGDEAGHTQYTTTAGVTLNLDQILHPSSTSKVTINFVPQSTLQQYPSAQSSTAAVIFQRGVSPNAATGPYVTSFTYTVARQVPNPALVGLTDDQAKSMPQTITKYTDYTDDFGGDGYRDTIRWVDYILPGSFSGITVTYSNGTKQLVDTTKAEQLIGTNPPVNVDVSPGTSGGVHAGNVYLINLELRPPKSATPAAGAAAIKRNPSHPAARVLAKRIAKRQ